MKYNRPGNRTLTTIATSSILLTSCAFMQPAPPPAYNPGTPAAEQADSFINIQDEKYLKNINKVAITSCNVMIAEVSRASAATSAGLFAGGGRSESKVTVLYTMAGLSDADMQAMADRICAEAESKLAAQGFDVVSVADLKAKSPAFSELQKAGKPSPFVFNSGETKYKVFGRSGDSIFDPRYIGIGGGFAQAFKAAAGTSAWQYEAQVADQAKISPINVNILVDFAELQSDGDKSLGGLANKDSATVTTKVQLSVGGDISAKSYDGIKCWDRLGKRECALGGTAILRNSRAISVEDTFYESIKNTTTTADAIASGVTKVFSLLAGGMSSEVTRYQVDVKPETFNAASAKATSGFLDMFSYKMSAVKKDD